MSWSVRMDRSISSPATPSRREGRSAPPKPGHPVGSWLEIVGKGAKFRHALSLAITRPLVKRAMPDRSMTLSDVLELDLGDPLGAFRQRFLLPDGIAYFDGHSLGPLPRQAQAKLGEVVEDQWVRDRTLADNLAIDSRLRGCDLVKIPNRDLVPGGSIRNRAIVTQQKTKRPAPCREFPIGLGTEHSARQG